MKREKKLRTPTDAERDTLVRVLTDMQLHGVHPLVANGVRLGVAELLVLAGRQDLAALWESLL